MELIYWCILKKRNRRLANAWPPTSLSPSWCHDATAKSMYNTDTLQEKMNLTQIAVWALASLRQTKLDSKSAGFNADQWLNYKKVELVINTQYCSMEIFLAVSVLFVVFYCFCHWSFAFSRLFNSCPLVILFASFFVFYFFSFSLFQFVLFFLSTS